jgi:hypothetical protein
MCPQNYVSNVANNAEWCPNPTPGPDPSPALCRKLDCCTAECDAQPFACPSADLHTRVPSPTFASTLCASAYPNSCSAATCCVGSCAAAAPLCNDATNKILRANAATIECAAVDCSVNECCEQSCAGYTCLPFLLDIDNKAGTACVGDCNAATCCLANCEGFDCAAAGGPSYQLSAAAATIACNGDQKSDCVFQVCCVAQCDALPFSAYCAVTLIHVTCILETL